MESNNRNDIKAEVSMKFWEQLGDVWIHILYLQLAQLLQLVVMADTKEKVHLTFLPTTRTRK